jgi:hypothetical protein
LIRVGCWRCPASMPPSWRATSGGLSDPPVSGPARWLRLSRISAAYSGEGIHGASGGPALSSFLRVHHNTDQPGCQTADRARTLCGASAEQRVVPALCRAERVSGLGTGCRSDAPRTRDRFERALDRAFWAETFAILTVQLSWLNFDGVESDRVFSDLARANRNLSLAVQRRG